MNATAHVIGRHPEDGLLLRFLDGECDPDEREDFAAHVAECVACHARLDAFRALSATVSRYLAGHEAVHAIGARRFPMLRAAAVVLFLGAAAASAQPIGRWIARLTSHPAAAPTGAATAPPAGDSSAGTVGRARVAFVPAGPTLQVVFRAAQRAGTLTLAPSADSSAAWAVTGGSVPPAVTVLPSGLVIANAPAATGSYRITVPAGVTAISLRIADRVPERIAWHPAAGTRTVALTPASR